MEVISSSKHSLLKICLARIFACWALIVFIITLLPVALLMWITGRLKEPGKTMVFQKISKTWMNVFFFFSGCSLKVKGKEFFKKGNTYIVTCNHNSLMDVPLSTPFIPGPNKTIAKVEMARIPLFGMIYKRGSVLVDRKDKNSRKNSFKAMKSVLSNSMHMCIYPEGTRNKTGLPLKDFYDGAFKLAIETGKPIIPALMFNTKKVFPSDKGFYFWPSAMEIHFLPEVNIEQADSPEILKHRVFEIMQTYYKGQMSRRMSR